MSRSSSRPGDRVVRRRLNARREIELPQPAERPAGPRHTEFHAKAFVSAVAAIICVGTALLMMPFVTRSGDATHVVDALFISASAVSVTGLVTVDTATHWNFGGQFIIMLLMQIGGISFTVGAGIALRLLSRGGRQSLRNAMMMLDGELTLPLHEAASLTRRVIRFTFIVEGLGVLALFAYFVRDEPIHMAFWRSVFTSVSAFNNGGFDIQGDFQSFTGFSGSVWINLVLIALITLGTISYIVVADVIEARGWRKLTPYTKLVLIVHGALIGIGFLTFLGAEWNGALAHMPALDRPMGAFFQSVSARSAGISTADFGSVSTFSDFVYVALMGVGGASGSPAGGVRIATLGVIAVAVVSIVRGSSEPELFHRSLPVEVVLRAVVVIVVFFFGHFVAAAALAGTEHLYGAQPPFIDVFFESMSAIATVGFSTGITPELSAPGKVVVTLSMFLGRLGPLLTVYALQTRHYEKRYRLPKTTIHIG